MKKLITILFTVSIISACHSREHLCSEYNGELPAADAPGILTTVKLQFPDKYQNTQIYVGKPDGTFVENGCYKINGNLLTLKAKNGDVSYYQIEKGQIRRLTMDKEPVTGPLADNYILKCIGH